MTAATDIITVTEGITIMHSILTLGMGMPTGRSTRRR